MMLRSLLLLILGFAAANVSAAEPVYRIQLETISRGYDGRTCWVHPRAGQFRVRSRRLR